MLINTVAIKKEIIIPKEVKIPVIFTGVTSLIPNERNPIAVVKHV